MITIFSEKFRALKCANPNELRSIDQIEVLSLSNVSHSIDSPAWLISKKGAKSADPNGIGDKPR